MGEEDFANGSGKGLRDKCAGDNERGISRLVGNFGPSGKRNAVGNVVSHVADLVISRTGDFIVYRMNSCKVNSNLKFLIETERFIWAWELLTPRMDLPKMQIFPMGKIRFRVSI